MYCKKCGAELEDEKFCPKCGSAVCENAEPESPAEAGQRSRSAKTRIVKLSAAIFAVIAVLLIFNLFRARTNFKGLYKKYCDPVWASVADDGSYLNIDTNPDDIEDYYNYSAVQAIVSINKKLKFPDYVYDDMCQTTFSDGVRTAESGKVTVSWRYHPDKGLEVKYYKK